MRNIISIWLHRYLGDEEALLLALIIIAGLVLIWFLGDVLAPFIIALIFAYILQGVVTTLVGLSMNRTWAVIVTFTAFTGVIAGFMVFVVPPVFSEVTAVIADLPDYSGVVSEALLAELFREINGFALAAGEEILTSSLDSLPGLFTLTIYATLVFILVFFLLKDWQVLAHSAKGFLPTRRGAMRIIWAEMDQQLANYLRGKAIEIVIVGVVSYIIFALFGLRYSVLLAVLVGLSVLIPFVGAFSVTIPVAFVAVFQWGLEPITVYLILAYVALQVLDGNVLVPLLFSEAVNLHPVVIILAILVFGGIWGIWGVFFAIPLATLIKALISAWPVTSLEEVEMPVSVISGANTSGVLTGSEQQLSE